MKILFLANRVPYPPFRGDKLKIFNLAKRLCQQHEVHLLTFAQQEEDWQYKEELEKIFTSVQFVSLPKWKSWINSFFGLFGNEPLQVHYFRSAAMHRALGDLLKTQSFDVIHVQHLRMAQYALPLQQIPCVLDLPDAFSLYWRRKQANSKNPFLKYFEQIEQKRVYHYERKLAAFPLSLVCSAEDKLYLEEEHHLPNISLLPNGVDTSVFYPSAHDYSHNHTLLFTGNMDYGPNVDAVQFFAKEIFPQILGKFPNTKFVIAGQRPVSKVLALASENVVVTGFVHNFAMEYNKASVVIAPLRFGAGTQNKVLEAMAMAVPVVCSNIGFKGLGIESGEGAIMQTDPQLFADTVIRLLSDPAMRQSVGEKGAQVIQRRFSWDMIAQQLAQYLSQVSQKA